MRSSGNWAHFRLRSSGAPFTQVTFIRSETDLGTSKAHVTRNVVRHNWQSEREPTTASKPRGVCAIKDYVLIWQYHVIREKVLDGPTVKTSVLPLNLEKRMSQVGKFHDSSNLRFFSRSWPSLYVLRHPILLEGAPSRLAYSS